MVGAQMQTRQTTLLFSTHASDSWVRPPPSGFSRLRTTNLNFRFRFDCVLYTVGPSVDTVRRQFCYICPHRRDRIMPQRLPPLLALRAFEAAGRLLSFTVAADELHLTQGAISRQVRQLEDF